MRATAGKLSWFLVLFPACFGPPSGPDGKYCILGDSTVYEWNQPEYGFSGASRDIGTEWCMTLSDGTAITPSEHYWIEITEVWKQDDGKEYRRTIVTWLTLPEGRAGSYRVKGDSIVFSFSGGTPSWFWERASHVNRDRWKAFETAFYNDLGAGGHERLRLHWKRG